MLLDWLLAITPILLIIILMVRFGWGAAMAGPAGWALTVCLAAARFGAGIRLLAVSHAKALLLGLDVLLIVWGAFLLYRVFDEAGAIAVIGRTLPQLTADRGMQALLIGWLFATFLQGIGGFGVPVAVTAPLLVGLGFAPLTAVILPTIGHAWAVTFGSLGSSFQALIAASNLPGGTLAAPAAALLGLAGIGSGFMVAQVADGLRSARKLTLPILTLGVLMGLTQLFLATHGLWNIASFGAGMVGLLAGVTLARRYRGGSATQDRTPIDARPFRIAVSGYLVLILVTFVVQFIPGVNQLLGAIEIRIAFPETETARGFITPAGYGRIIPLLRHAGAILGYAALISFLIYRRYGLYRPRAGRRILTDTARRLIPSSVGILSMVAMAVVMTHTGMTDVLASGLALWVARAFPFLSTWLGALGAFITGSNTNSNLIFAMLQRRTAELLQFNLPWILAAQTAGAAIGSVVSPTKILVGVSTTQIANDEGTALRAMLRYILPLLLGVALVAWIAISLSSP
jgi:lactate permease